MTHRVIWTEPGQWWPSHQDFASPLAAHAFAMETADRVGDGVEVREIGGGS